MSAIAVAVKHMLAAGMPHDAIVAAVAEMEASVAPVRSKAADRQARYRERNKASQNVTRDAPLSLPPNENNSNPPTHTREYNTTREGRKNQPPAKPDDVAEQTWRDFLRHRNAKKAPVTETALVGIRREAARAGWTMDAALAETVTRGWQSFKADWAVSALQPASASPGSFLASLGSGP